MTVGVSWREAAACRDADPDLFFPVGTAGPALRQVEEAKRICRACPAQAPCLAWALDHGVGSGVWGGTTEEERRARSADPRGESGHQPGRDDAVNDSSTRLGIKPDFGSAAGPGGHLRQLPASAWPARR
jgi:WhiB family redox-sensing transcriptional regulator